MFKLIINTIRHKKGIFVGTFISIILTMMLLTMCWSLLVSAITGNENVTRYINTDMVVMPKQKIYANGENTTLKGIDYIEAPIIHKLEKIDGIDKIIKDYTFYAVPINKDGKAISSIDGANIVGHSWSGVELTNFKLTQGNKPTQGQIVIDKKLAKNQEFAVGDKIRIATSEDIEEFVISGIIDTNYDSIYEIQSAIFFNEDDSVRISRLKGPNALGIKLDHRENYKRVYDNLKKTYGISPYKTTSAPVDSIDLGSIDYIGSISVFGTLAGLTIFAAIFVIVGTISFSIQQRFMDLALLRGIGLTPKQIKKMLSTEMVLLTILGYIIGCPLGIKVTPWVADKFIKMGAIPRQFELTFSTGNMLLVLAAGLCIALISAYSASKRIVKISPTEAMRQSTIRTNRISISRTIIGLLFIVGAMLILILVPMKGAAGIGFNFLASLCFIIGVTTLGEYLIKIMSVIISLFVKAFGAPGSLASSNSKMYSYRMVSAALAITLMIALNGGILINTLMFNEASLKEQYSSYENKTVITSVKQGIPWNILDDIDEISEKADVFATAKTEVYFCEKHGNDADDYKLEDYDAIGIYSNSEQVNSNFNIAAGDVSKLSNNDICISKHIAKKYDFNIGDKINLYFNDKTEKNFRIVALHNTEGIDSPEFIFNSNVIRKHDFQSMISTFYFNAPKQEIDNELTLLKNKWPVILVNAGQSLNQEQNLKTQNAVIYMMILISLSFTVIAICNTFAITISSRKSEYRNLWLIGATPEQMLKMISLETWTIILVGVILGATINSICISVFSNAQGLGTKLIGNSNVYFGLIGISVVISLVSSKFTAIKTVKSSAGTVRHE